MRHRISLIAVTLLMIASLALAQSSKSKMAAHSNMKGHDSHVIMSADEVKWGPAPPSLPPGAQAAIIDGDPSKAGSSFTIRLKAPDGYKVPPHWHPVAEHVTVLEGTFVLGTGDKFDESAGKEMGVGAFASMPKGVRHFAWAKGETIIQVHGIGPFELIYVNPADDPRKKMSH